MCSGEHSWLQSVKNRCPWQVSDGSKGLNVLWHQSSVSRSSVSMRPGAHKMPVGGEWVRVCYTNGYVIILMLEQNIKTDISWIFFVWRRLSLAFRKGDLNKCEMRNSTEVGRCLSMRNNDLSCQLVQTERLSVGEAEKRLWGSWWSTQDRNRLVLLSILIPQFCVSWTSFWCSLGLLWEHCPPQARHPAPRVSTGAFITGKINTEKKGTLSSTCFLNFEMYLFTF